MSYAIAYLVATAIFLLIDAIWLGVVAKNFYADKLGYLMADNIRFGVAAAFYASDRECCRYYMGHDNHNRDGRDDVFDFE